MCPSRLAYSKVCVPWDLSSYIGGSITPGRSNQAEQMGPQEVTAQNPLACSKCSDCN
uniref:Uncharacterized protein n=1 Tax=Arion vulgaris TaxID=1028688 RepID=A0A0B7BNW3_9EUPU